ncbi:MAG: pyruvate dehydrogenase (acetyl-transferring) E1 component subunit alpha, partial [Gemmatimonadetes bacterium]|nr:pyruvate dehydrogenase (acetyl-transferring) E1 component subunit alpha [Gemmatimonadota bacterium]NIV22523.1 pyruvate dehydrogenase (acetyl-transferring) E1 component subunit alpha [Gemmatimonadota bacterium]NIW74379.1 pyruvate dehydrogenase (acetyl-transferring) E1 component subunit alpha [Gemmatimonadota bacterium]
MSDSLPFGVHTSTIIAPDGNLLRPIPQALADAATIRSLYEWLHRTRAFDAKAIELQRTGRLGTYASCLGQEAASVGIGHAMAREDVLVPSFRDQGTQLYRGVSMVELLLYWGGDERGSNYAVPRDDLPISITVGGHAPHAAGVALALKLRAEPRVAVCVFGDGATSKGDVYEAMNIAGVWRLPVVFVVNNNQWAISTPRADQSAAATLAQKSIAAGFEGRQVDGNDVLAVSEAVGNAIEHARSGGGPSLVECLTYRLGDHTTVDDASRYRTEAEVARWQELDPVTRLGAYLTRHANWTDADDAALRQRCEDEVGAAATAYIETSPQPAESMFDHL